MRCAYEVNLMNEDEFDGCRLYTGVRLDYRFGLWAPTSTSGAISAVAELLAGSLVGQVVAVIFL